MTERRRHLLWVNHFVVAPSEAGGTRHFEMARALIESGWKVTLVGSDFHLQSRTFTRRKPDDHRTVRETIDGVDFRWLHATPYARNDGRRMLNWLSFARRLLREPWDDSAPDVVIGSSPHLFAAWAAARVARRAQVPFLFEVRDLWPESLLAGGRRPGVTYYALSRIARSLYAKADRIVVLARGSGDYLEERGIPAARLRYVPNGVDLSAFPEAARPVRETFTLLYAGAHGPLNGLDAVIGAARLLRERPAIRFLLVGDGPAKQGLMAEVARRGLTNVEFRDPVPKREVPSLLAQADAGLMVLREAPLFSFGVSPNKLFDYFGAGLPVVCNVPGDVAEMVATSGAGEQAPDASAATLAKAAERLYDRSPADRSRMGAAGRDWVGREHSRPLLAARLDGILREVVG
jgi:glycosyltransferase involved in cell wall biosynthesis